MDDHEHIDGFDGTFAGLAHDPVRPCRAGVPGERAFLDGWRALNGPDPVPGGTPLQRCVLEFGDDPTQRDATLAASFMQWLGTNAGADLVREGRALAEALDGPAAFLAAWSVRNLRLRHMNHGLRTLEAIMDPAGVADGTWAAPVLTTRDHELADHLAAWLGSAAGRRFLAAHGGDARLRTGREGPLTGV